MHGFIPLLKQLSLIPDLCFSACGAMELVSIGPFCSVPSQAPICLILLVQISFRIWTPMYCDSGQLHCQLYDPCSQPRSTETCSCSQSILPCIVVAVVSLTCGSPKAVSYRCVPYAAVSGLISCARVVHIFPYKTLVQCINTHACMQAPCALPCALA